MLLRPGLIRECAVAVELLNHPAVQRLVLGAATAQPDRPAVHVVALVVWRLQHRIIIIDEYDTPIQQGHTCGFYEDVIRFIRNLFSGGLKDNPHLSYGFLTGILRVAQESIFSGLNNLKINSILDSRYSTYFGLSSISAYAHTGHRETAQPS